MAGIVIYTSGTLGDHLPFISLARALRDRGHQVRLAINQAMHSYAVRAGLEAVALSDVDRGPEQARANAWAWDFWNTPDQSSHPNAPPFDLDQFMAQARELIDLCKDADLLISTTIRPLGFIVYHALKLPWISVSMNPYTFWRPSTALEHNARFQGRIKEYQQLTPLIAYAFNELGISDEIPCYSDAWLYSNRVLLASSLHFSRPGFNQLQPHASIDLTGFWEYRDPDWADWQPDERLEDFCSRRPMVLSFSSQPLERPGKVLECHVNAARRLGVPLLIQRGWADFSEKDLPSGTRDDDVLFADFLPHDWLFSKASCAIQHGGIGSIASALRQGCPLLIEPYGNDQIYNASRVAGSLGVGAAMHPFKMTEDGLVETLRDTVLGPGCRDRAREIGEKMRGEDGLGTACGLIETYLSTGEGAGERPALLPPFLPSLHPGLREYQERAVLSWRETGEIPKIIHQTWKNTDISPEWLFYRQSWQDQHPGWLYFFWTDDDNREFIRQYYPWFLRIYDAYPEPIMRADAVRYFLLYHYGGVYVDLDFQCLKPVDELIRGRQVVLGCEPEAHLKEHMPMVRPFRNLVCNAFMASVPGHPFWDHVCRNLITYRRAPGALNATGPLFLSRVLTAFPESESITVLPEEVLYPATQSESMDHAGLDPVKRARVARNAWAVHHWHNAWVSESTDIYQDSVDINVSSSGTVEKETLKRLAPLRDQLKKSSRSPKVTCLMEAGKDLDAVKRSIHCFLQQTYPYRELVIRDPGNRDELKRHCHSLKDQRIRIMPDFVFSGVCDRVSGDLIAIWHHEDLPGRDRLEIQVAALQEFEGDACFLERRQVILPGHRQVVFTSRDRWEDTLMARRESLCLNQWPGSIFPVPAGQETEDRHRAVRVDFPQLSTVLYDDTCGPEDAFMEAPLLREPTDFFDADLYEVIVEDVQNRLGVDLSSCLGISGSVSGSQMAESSGMKGKGAGKAGTGIPRILHQTWKDEMLPGPLEAYRQTWLDHHPDWLHCLWTDKDIRGFILRHYPWFLTIFDGYPEPIMRVDAARYFILHHYGGVYADLDMECFKPLDDVLEHKELFLPLEPRVHAERSLVRRRGLAQLVSNALMASVPGHPFWEHLFKLLVAFHREKGPLDATGPCLLQRAYLGFPWQERISVEPSERFMPITNVDRWDEMAPEIRQKIRTHAYTLHHWQGSWIDDAEGTPSAVARGILKTRGNLVSEASVNTGYLKNAMAMEDLLPLVSCVMVTKNRPGLATIAVQCFLNQDYRNRELVIIDDGEDSSLEEWVSRLAESSIRYYRLTPENKPLGFLRNLSVERASGEYIAQWDDDDLSDPERLSVMMAVIRAFGTDACFLQRQQIWWPESRRFAVSASRVWEGSFVCRKSSMTAYPEKVRGEDTDVAQKIITTGRTILLDAPWLYTYVFHGRNTFGSAHWEPHWLAATAAWEGEAADTRMRRVAQRLDMDVKTLNRGEFGDMDTMKPGTRSAGRTGAADPSETGNPRVLILVPVKDGMSYLPAFMENLKTLSYPHDRIHLAFLESDSLDGSYAFIEERLDDLRAAFAGAVVFKRDYGYRMSGPRWEMGEQFRRRSIMARSRNFLLSRALTDQDWVLWIDCDVASWPPTVIQELLASKRDIVVPDCVQLGTGQSFDLNSFILKPEARDLDGSPYIVDGIFQPPKGFGRRYLSDFRGQEIVELDSVGGTMLMVRADLHREGLIFPSWSYRHAIETEGLAAMAKDMGYQCWGLPNLIVYHP